ncbi:hypothetical protein PIB30_079632, partial [Stylosanthes scabra]|nr:hypothetical protein [Stylosanthes scabra]
MAMINLVYQHGGQFVTKDDGDMVYEMEEIDVEKKIDVDTLDVFAMRNHYKALGHDKIVQYSAGERNGNKIHLYYEHAVFVPNLVEDCPKLIEMTSTPTQLQIEAPTIIDLEIPSQKDI